MQTLSALCNPPVIGLHAITCEGVKSTQRDESLEVNQMNISKLMGIVAVFRINPLNRRIFEANVSTDEQTMRGKTGQRTRCRRDQSPVRVLIAKN